MQVEVAGHRRGGLVAVPDVNVLCQLNVSTFEETSGKLKRFQGPGLTMVFCFS